LQPAPVALIVGHTYDKRTRKPLGAKLEVMNLVRDELLSVYNSNSATGEFFITAPVGFEYGITATAAGYAFFSEHYTPPDTAKFKEVRFDIYLTPVDTAVTALANDSLDIIKLNNIFFDFGKATLRDESKPELKNIITFLKKYPTLRIEIGGHTDSVGTDEVNRVLSQQRAEAVRAFIINGGITAARVTAKGYGESMPVAPNDTEENMQKNRRTEFRIIRKPK
jgi:outer membrane protein OmpA-like peptidoglycan-associated protein